MLSTREQTYIDACLEGDINKIECMIRDEDKQFKNNRFLLKCLNSACEGGYNNIFMTLLEYRNVLNTQSKNELRSLLQYAGKGCNIDIINFIVRLYKTKYNDVHLIWNKCLIGICESDKSDKSNNLQIFKMYAPRVSCIHDCVIECLHGAYESGNVILVNYLVGMYKIHDHAYVYGFMTSACLSGNLELINKHIKNIVPLDLDTWLEPLSASLTKGNIEVAKSIIEHVSLIKSKALNRLHGIHSRLMRDACYGGNIQAIELITNWGTVCLNLTQLNIFNSLNNGLYGACNGGHIEIVKFLISKGVTDWNGGSLGACCSEGGDMCKNVVIIMLMIAFGASNFEMILKYACSRGYIELAQLAILNGAVNFKGGLVTACKNGNAEMVRLMIKHGSGNITRTYLNEGLQEVVHGNENTDILNLLITAGANNLERLKNIKDFKLYCRYCRHTNIAVDIKKYTKFLCEYPPYILLVGSKVKRNESGKLYNICCFKKLPVELFRLLCKYL